MQFKNLSVMDLRSSPVYPVDDRRVMIDKFENSNVRSLGQN